MLWLLRKTEVTTHNISLPPFSFNYYCYIGCCREESIKTRRFGKEERIVWFKVILQLVMLTRLFWQNSIYNV